jgi:phytoene synthase
VYAWCRALDETVDAAGAAGAASDDASLHRLRRELNAWQSNITQLWDQQTMQGTARKSLRPEELALADTITRVPGLQPTPFSDMVQGMFMDVQPSVRYQTFNQLYTYCYRVAGTVALMAMPVFGLAPTATLEEATPPGVALGIALQLTNICRDVGEDLQRGRIYLPTDDLARFGLTEQDIRVGRLGWRYRALMEYQIDRAMVYYARAQQGLPMLAPTTRLTVQALGALYRRILDQVRRSQYDNISQRAFTTKWQKLAAMPHLWWQTNVTPPTAASIAAVDWPALPEPEGSAVGVLLALARTRAADTEVERAVEQLLALQPSSCSERKPAQSDLLLGDWELVWSSAGSDFSRLSAKIDALPFNVDARSLQALTATESCTVVDIAHVLRIEIVATISADVDDAAGRRTLVSESAAQPTHIRCPLCVLVV